MPKKMEQAPKRRAVKKGLQGGHVTYGATRAPPREKKGFGAGYGGPKR